MRFTMVSPLFFLATLFFLISSCQSEECKPINTTYPWFNVSGTWLAVTKSIGTWSDTVHECRNIEPGRSSIARILGQSELNGLSKSKIPLYHYYWIGGIREVRTREWYWFRDNGKATSLEVMGNTFWNRGEPNNGNGNENCLDVYNGSGWNDYSCDANFHGLCEIRC